MTLDPDEKELLESFERGEWRSVDADEIARTRELARHQLRTDVGAGGRALSGEGRSQSSDSGGRLAKQIKAMGRAARSTKS